MQTRSDLKTEPFDSFGRTDDTDVLVGPERKKLAIPRNEQVCAGGNRGGNDMIVVGATRAAFARHDFAALPVKLRFTCR